MSNIILKAENISKQYRLGNVGSGTLRDDFKRNWARIRGKEDPFLKVGAVNDRSQKSTEDYVWALRDINFEVKQGEVLGIIGKNGAGKSTLLKILSRVTAPSTGVIKSRGRIASLLEVGTGFNHELTGRENIYLNGAILGMTKAEISSKLDEIIDFSGCERYIDTPTKRYSSGMTVRLAFAVAAFLEPEILVVDEVLAVGDAEFQKKAIGKMQDISKGEGRTVLFVSHNMISVKSLCSRLLVLNNGLVRFEGGIQEGVDYYLKGEDTVFENQLADRTTREGDNSIFKFVDVKLMDSANNSVKSLSVGDPLRIQLHFQSNPLIDLSEIIITIGIKDTDGNLITFWSSDEIGFNLSMKNSDDSFDLFIPKLFLRAGEYRLWLFSSYKNTSPANFCDVIDYATLINVISKDYFLSGKVLRNNANFFMDGQFL